MLAGTQMQVVSRSRATAAPAAALLLSTEDCTCAFAFVMKRQVLEHLPRLLVQLT